MIVFLSESDVQAAITMPETLTIVEAAFRDHALGQATILPRVRETLPGTAGMFRIVSATLPTQKMFGLKTLTGSPGKRLEDEVYFAILLFEMRSGALRAVISANYLTGLRTGAAKRCSGQVSCPRGREVAGYHRHRSASLVPGGSSLCGASDRFGKLIFPQ
jgi:alanine dehydrogenase